jgi:hypothetical protein
MAPSYGVFQISIPGPEPLPGFFSILPKLGVEGNILQSLQGTTSKGLLSLIFPNGEAAMTGWGILSGDVMPNMLKKVSAVDIKPHIPEMYGQGKGFFGTTLPGGK